MKYGLDINNSIVLNCISESLKSKGYFVINLNEKENLNSGKALLKRVLIVNVTKIDFYFIVEFKNNIHSYEIFYSNFKEAINLSKEIKELLKDENIIYENGEKFYLIKNTNIPAIYMRIPKEEEKNFEIKYLNLLTNIFNTSL